MRLTYRRIALAAALTALSSLAVSGTALAHHAGSTTADPITGCGQVVTASLTLTHDVGPCAPAAADGAALKVDARSTITLDLNGKRVIGCTSPASACNTGGVPSTAAYVTGEGPGILVNNSTFVTVKNGTVEAFDSGVVVHGGNSNTLTGLSVKDNIGTAATSSDYGEGIGIYRSSLNTVVNSTADHNGPYAGIGLYDFSPDGSGLVTLNTTTDANKVGQVDANGNCPNGRGATGNGNTVSNNYVEPNGTTFQDDGIRVEPRVTNTMVDCNVVTGSSLDGIAVFGAPVGSNGARATKVRNNDVSGNGKHPATHRKGDGIVVFLRADNCMVSGNRVTGNAGNGIRVDALGCTIRNNTPVGGNAFNTGVSGSPVPDPRGLTDPKSQYAYFDLKDGNGNCTANTWSGNDPLGTRWPACINLNPPYSPAVLA